MKMLRIILLMLLFTCFSLYGEYVSFDEAISLLKSKSAKNYPSSDNLYIVNNKTEILHNGTGVEIIEEYRKVLTNSSQKENELMFGYDKNYTYLKVDEIKLVKSNGNITKYNPEDILVQKDNSFLTNANIYSNTSKILTGDISDLEKGDIIYTKITRTINKARMKGQLFDVFEIESYSPYLNRYSEITLPVEKKLYIHELNNHGYKYEYKTRKRGNTISHLFNVKNTPLVIREPNMERYNFVVHHLKLTTVKEWEEISRWYYNLVEPHIQKTTDEIRKKSYSLIKGCRNRKEKVEKIFYWVAQKIRYLGVDKESNRPGYEPHDVDYTFNTRGGVCRDKAALLSAMLRSVGINSDVILISSGNRLNKEAPVLWFNHAISVSYDKKGEPEFFMDPTSETTKDLLPKYEEDNTYLIASKKGTSLRVTPISKPLENNSSINIDLKVESNNSATGKIDFLFSGLSDTVLRGSFLSATKHEIKESIERLVTGLNPNIELLGFEYTEPNNRSKNMFISARVKITDYISTVKDKLIIPFDATKLKMHMLYNYALGSFNLSSRKYDFVLPGSFSFDIKYNLEYYQKFTGLSVPNPKNLDFKGFKTTFNSEVKDKTLQVNYHFEINKIHFKQKDYRELKQKLAGLESLSNMFIIGTSGGKYVR